MIFNEMQLRLGFLLLGFNKDGFIIEDIMAWLFPVIKRSLGILFLVQY